MLFNFKLRPIEKIVSWGKAGNRTLHWFGLTDGWYWIKVGQDELLRCSEEAMDAGYLPVESERVPYCDYQVVRLWEDVQEILPEVLSPVPEEIIKLFSLDPNAPLEGLLGRDFTPDERNFNAEWDLWCQATGWFDRRKLSQNHLKYSPQVYLWSDSKKVFIHWDNRKCCLDNVPIWTAQYGTFSLPVESFIAEVRQFDRLLIDAMQQRVTNVETNWQRPDVKIDLIQLREEHIERSEAMERTFQLCANYVPQPWAEVVKAFKEIEHLPNRFA